MNFIKYGSSKDIYEIPEEGLLAFHYTDRVSVFDIGPVPVMFPKLGHWRSGISNKLFKLLNEAGFETAFCRPGLGYAAKMYSLNVPESGLEFKESIGRLLPIELIFRFTITEKFMGRINSGKVDKAKVEKLLQGNTLQVGARLDPPYVEATTKQQAADVYVSDKEAALICGISLAELYYFYEENVIKLAEFLRQTFKNIGFNLVDGKFEGGITRERKFILADSISPDELRLIGEDGNSFDKDPVRQWYKDNYPDWVKELERAKLLYPNDKSRWPSYPAPPSAEVIVETVGRYEAVGHALGVA